MASMLSDKAGQALAMNAELPLDFCFGNSMKYELS